MPGWIQVAIAIAAALSAFAVIWSKAIKPGAKIISQAETAVPLLKQLTEEWHDVPGLPQILKQIADQFKTNKGSSLRDAINRLELAAEENKKAALTNAEAVKNQAIDMEVNRRMAEQDRIRFETLVNLVQTLNARVQLGTQEIIDVRDEHKDFKKMAGQERPIDE